MLYKKNQIVTPDLTKDEFRKQYSTLAVISTESVDLYLGKIKDTFLGINRAFDKDTERFLKEVDVTRFETLARAKRVKFGNFRYETVSKPEQFSGYYVDYMRQLVETTEVADQLIDSLLSNLKMAVSTFINEYSPTKSDMMYGHKGFTDAEKIIEGETKAIAAYFKAPPGKVRTKTQDVIKSFNDLPGIYAEFDKLKLMYTPTRHAEIETHVKSSAELIDVLIDLNTKSNILNRNNAMKKQLVDGIHITAAVVEYYYATYANVLFMAKAFVNLTEALNNNPED